MLATLLAVVFFARVGVPAAAGLVWLDLRGCAPRGAERNQENRGGRVRPWPLSRYSCTCRSEFLAAPESIFAITYGMKATGERAVRPRALFQFLGRALLRMVLGGLTADGACSFYSLGGGVFFFFFFFFFFFLLLRSWEPISLVSPASALSYVVVTLGATLLGEQ